MLKKLLKVSLVLLPIVLFIFFFLPLYKALGVFLGVFISAMSILISAWILEVFWDRKWNQFIKIFFFSLIIRFLVVIGTLGILLATTKIDEIYFTVSFIISYLCYSITEMIFFNKILDKKSSQK